MPLTLQVRVGCEFRLEADLPTTSVFQVEPHPGVDHGVSGESWQCAPQVELREYRDAFDNRCRRGVIPAGSSVIRYEATVEVSGEPDEVRADAAQVPPEELPDDTIRYLLPSRYCLPDKLGGVAMDSFSEVQPGWGQVEAISRWVHEHIAYTLGSTDSTSDAADVYLQRMGVCRDYAHLAISFCRALNYPARYACGYIPLLGRPLPEEGIDFSAWMEVFLEGGWYVFDPRNGEALAGRVLIGRGRDAVDVAMLTSAGALRLTGMTVLTDA